MYIHHKEDTRYKNMFNKNISYVNIILFISLSILTYLGIKKKLKRMDKYKDYINQNQN
jgi:hypothetical protein